MFDGKRNDNSGINGTTGEKTAFVGRFTLLNRIKIDTSEPISISINDPIDSKLQFRELSWYNEGVFVQSSDAFSTLIENKNPIGNELDLTVRNNDESPITVQQLNNLELMINYGSVILTYEPYTSDTRTLDYTSDYPDGMAELPDGTKDDSGTKRVSDVITFDGSVDKDWSVIASLDQPNSRLFQIPLTNLPNLVDGVSDNFNFSTSSLANVDQEGIYTFNNTLRIRINRSRLSTEDTDGFREWLSNNITIVRHGLTTSIKITTPQSPLYYPKSATYSYTLPSSKTLAPTININYKANRISLIESKVDAVEALNPSTSTAEDIINAFINN